MPADKNKTRNIKDGKRNKITDYRHQFAIDILELHTNNIEMEIAQKKRVIKEVILDRTADQSPVRFLGIRIRKLKVELVRLERSIRLLEKNNKPLPVDLHTLALSSAKIE
jgi:hypothetical protein